MKLPLSPFFAGAASAAIASALLAAPESTPHPRFGFPVYKNKPAGRQLSGQHAPAGNPAMSPEDQRKSFKVPPGFEVRLFASEPDVVNPVAMSFDERGRLWVLELYEYPLGVKPGEAGRDRIKILEDTDGDGRADKVTVFADGMSLATGLLVGHGGVYVGEAPHLWFMQDTKGTGVADRKVEVLTGFGREDRHELLNGFTWGPDGQLYMTHGVFTRTEARDAANPSARPTLISAGVARMNPKTRSIEVYSEGTSNPWGVDFDARGNAFVSACVIDHLFHLVPGGLYNRQAGQPPFQYGYGELKSIVDYRHHMAAYAGVDVYQGDQWPASWKGEILVGNIHQNALNHEHVEPMGASFKAQARPDFMTTADGWFMPVSTQTGPDGAVWVMDWYDRYPCYQNAQADPDGIDRERGRIWRVVWVGDQAGKPVPSRPSADMDLSKLSSVELTGLLAHPNVWHQRTARRLLGERGATAFGPRTLHAKTPVHELLKSGTTPEARLNALWTLHEMGLLEDETLDEVAADADPGVRSWAARITGERGLPLGDAIKRLAKLAEDPDPTVRLGVTVAARQFVSGSLTIDTPPLVPVSEVVTGPVLSALFRGHRNAAQKTPDPTLDFLYWMALEPIVAYDPVHAVNAYTKDGASAELPFSATLLTKIMRRACDLRDDAVLGRVVLEFGKIPENASPALIAGLKGLIDGQRGRASNPGAEAVTVISRLTASANAEVAQAARQLGTLWGDAAALKASLARITDPSASEAERLAGIKAARTVRGEDVRKTLVSVINSKESETVRIEAIRALADVGADDSGKELLSGWAAMSPAVRRAAAELCTTRNAWRWSLFNAVERGDVKRGDLTPSVIRTLATSRDDDQRMKAQNLFGRVNASSSEKLKLIAEKRRVVTTGPVDLPAGHEVAKKTCFVCHKLYGEGAEIGPDLTGVGRSSLDALLHNVIHPNEIIGQGYENVEVETKDDRQLSGRMVENNDRVVRLVMAGPTEVVIGKADVKSLRITENSVMPEGLEQMPDADFRNLIWYILAPPGDNKPLDESRRRELMGGGGSDERASVDPAGSSDGESVALWNPEWRVTNPVFADAPRKLPSFQGRNNVLVTHPRDEATPGTITRMLEIPRGQAPVLEFWAAAVAKNPWDLAVLVDGEAIRTVTVRAADGAGAEPWRRVQVDLSKFAGRRVAVRLEHRASPGEGAYGYWSDLRLATRDLVKR